MPTDQKDGMHHDINMFYRDAGAKDAPVLLLLHGFRHPTLCTET